MYKNYAYIMQNIYIYIIYNMYYYILKEYTKNVLLYEVY